MKRLISTVLAVLMNVFIISNAFASGFAIYTQGASSLGQGAATIAHGDDPSVIFFNPALMNKLQGTQIQLGTTLLFPKRKFESDISGEVFKAKRDIFYPSTFYITHKFNEKVSGGIGFFNPFGLATEWPDGWPGRYITTKAEMTTYNINPVVSIQIIPEVSIAAGLNFLWLDASLENNINLSYLPFALGLSPFPLPLPDGKQRFKGDGSGAGYNLGILIEPHKDISIGASYRSRINVDIDGKASYKNIPPLFSRFFRETGGKTDITLPAQGHLGIYYKGFEPLTLEIGMRWEGWSSYDRLRIRLENGIISDTPKNWKDTYSANIGVKYGLNESVSLLAGYLYSGNPIPDRTFEPSIPDSNTHLFTIGTSIRQKKFKIDMAYGFQILEGRKKDNAIGDPINPFDPNLTANGKYKSHLHMLGLSLTYLF
jgi:long-chain fatty acid transport protein